MLELDEGMIGCFGMGDAKVEIEPAIASLTATATANETDPNTRGNSPLCVSSYRVER